MRPEARFWLPLLAFQGCATRCLVSGCGSGFQFSVFDFGFAAGTFRRHRWIPASSRRLALPPDAPPSSRLLGPHRLVRPPAATRWDGPARMAWPVLRSTAPLAQLDRAAAF